MKGPWNPWSFHGEPRKKFLRVPWNSMEYFFTVSRGIPPFPRRYVIFCGISMELHRRARMPVEVRGVSRSFAEFREGGTSRRFSAICRGKCLRSEPWRSPRNDHGIFHGAQTFPRHSADLHGNSAVALQRTLSMATRWHSVELRVVRYTTYPLSYQSAAD